MLARPDDLFSAREKVAKCIDRYNRTENQEAFNLLAIRGERAAWKADTHDSCSSIPPIVDRRRRKGWINGEAGVAPGRARIIPAPPSRRLGVGRVSLGKHSARPTPFFLAIGE